MKKQITPRGKPAKWIVFALVAAVIVVLIPLRRPAWRLLRTKRVTSTSTVDGHAVEGWLRARRWDGEADGEGEMFYVENGQLASRSESRDRQLVRYTAWRFDGTVMFQLRSIDESDKLIPIEQRREPPWWWRVEDVDP